VQLDGSQFTIFQRLLLWYYNALDANMHNPQKRMREREGGGKDDQQSTTVQQLLKKLIYECQWERIPDVEHDTQIRRCNGRWGRKKPK
jgi:hypothetical protein